MRFKETNGFFSHLKDASFDHLCQLYLIIVPDEYERLEIIKYSKRFFFKDNSDSNQFDGKDLSYQKIFQEIASPTLFSKNKLFIIDNIQKFLELEKLTPVLDSFKENFFLIAAPSLKGIGVLEKKIEKFGVILDLSKEKVWDRNARIEKMLFLKAKIKNVDLSISAQKKLIEKVGHNLSLLDQALKKLILFTYDSKKIEAEDVEEVVALSNDMSIWQMAEKLVFEKRYPNFEFLNASDVQLFLSAIRYQLQLGFKMSLLIKSKLAKNDLKSHFPKLWPKQFEKILSQVQKTPLIYFQKSLKNLFDIELSLRDSAISHKAILDLFISKLNYEQI